MALAGRLGAHTPRDTTSLAAVDDAVHCGTLEEATAFGPDFGRSRTRVRGAVALVDGDVVTSAEASAVRAHVHSDADCERVAFLQHFGDFDARTKRQTLEIPTVNVTEIERLIYSYFPDGKLVW